jgi:mRNA interferase MazF
MSISGFREKLRDTHPAQPVGPLKQSGCPVVLNPSPVNAITSKGQPLDCRSEFTFQGKPARILLDQIRSLDKKRRVGTMGEVDVEPWHDVLMQMLT